MVLRDYFIHLEPKMSYICFGKKESAVFHDKDKSFMSWKRFCPKFMSERALYLLINVVLLRPQKTVCFKLPGRA